MDNRHITELLKKYYDGESSIEEEKQLSDFLNEDGLSEEFLLEKDQFLFFQQERNAELPEDFEEILEKTILEQEERKVFHLNYFKNWPSVAAVVLIAVGVSWWFMKSEKVEWQEQTTSGEMQTEVVLADGSTISLNNNSQVNYPDKFDDNREIYFQGEGFFEIEPDPDRPFMIHTESALVEVLGTSFNVRNYEKEPNIVVSVVSGKVAFSSMKDGLQEKIFLLKGEQAIYNKRTNRLEKSPIHTPNHMAWKTKNLTFDNDLMSDVIGDMERYFDINIETKNEAILNCHFKGDFNNPQIEELLEVLAYSMGISYEIKEEQYLFVGQGCANDSSSK